MSSPKRTLYRLMLAAILLFAQHVAFAHQMGHAVEHAAFQSQPPDLCAFHGDFESLLGAVCGFSSTLRACTVDFQSHSVPSAAHAPVELIVPVSRGPPSPHQSRALVA